MTIDELGRCIRVLLQLAEQRGVRTLDLEGDLYWTMSSPEWRHVYAEPAPKPAVGSLIDDEAELRKVLLQPDRASAVDLERAAHLLLLLSDQLVEGP